MQRIALERENGDLRRQIDNYLYTSNPSFETDDIEELEHTELKRRYGIYQDVVCLHTLQYLFNCNYLIIVQKCLNSHKSEEKKQMLVEMVSFSDPRPRNFL